MVYFLGVDPLPKGDASCKYHFFSGAWNGDEETSDEKKYNHRIHPEAKKIYQQGIFFLRVTTSLKQAQATNRHQLYIIFIEYVLLKIVNVEGLRV